MQEAPYGVRIGAKLQRTLRYHYDLERFQADLTYLFSSTFWPISSRLMCRVTKNRLAKQIIGIFGSQPSITSRVP